MAIYSISRFLLQFKLFNSHVLQRAVDQSLSFSLLLGQNLSWCKTVQLCAHQFFFQTKCSMKASKQLENPEAAFLPQNKNKFPVHPSVRIHLKEEFISSSVKIGIIFSKTKRLLLLIF